MAQSKPQKGCRQPEHSLRVKFISAGLAACVADLATFPLDTTKVRMQIRNKTSQPSTETKSMTTKRQATRVPTGLLATMRNIFVKEGPLAFYSGLVPGLQRQLCFASIRIGFYDDVKDYYQNLFGYATEKSPNNYIRVLAGLTTGAMCVTVAQPTDVVKVRMQAQGAGKTLYTGVIQAYTTIGRQEGFKGLWKGYYPNVARNSLINVSEVVTYDVIKETVIRRGWFDDTVFCHVFCGFASGLCATLIASPVDVIKTRYMNSPAGQFNGALDCAVQMVKQNGPLACYQGFVPSFVRLGCWNIVMFVAYEQLKGLLSSKPLSIVPAQPAASILTDRVISTHSTSEGFLYNAIPPATEILTESEGTVLD